MSWNYGQQRCLQVLEHLPYGRTCLEHSRYYSLCLSCASRWSWNRPTPDTILWTNRTGSSWWSGTSVLMPLYVPRNASNSRYVSIYWCMYHCQSELCAPCMQLTLLISKIVYAVYNNTLKFFGLKILKNIPGFVNFWTICFPWIINILLSCHNLQFSSLSFDLIFTRKRGWNNMFLLSTSGHLFV